jgi:hypothetical protein
MCKNFIDLVIVLDDEISYYNNFSKKIIIDFQNIGSPKKRVYSSYYGSRSNLKRNDKQQKKMHILSYKYR